MRILFCIALFVAVALLFSGCVQQPAAPSPEATPAPAGTAAASVLAELSDKSPNASFPMDPGLILVTFRAEGVQKLDFSFSHGTDYGAYTYLKTNDTFSGLVAFAAPEKGTYQLNISGTGPWTARATLPEMTKPLAVPVNFSGTGTEVTPFFTLEKGQYIFERSETGFGSPLYIIQYANGSYLMNANNTMGQPHFGIFSEETFQFVDVPVSGTYFVSVIAESNPHDWAISIMPAPVIPPMGPGPVLPVNST